MIMGNKNSTATGWLSNSIIIKAHTLQSNKQYSLVLEYGYATSEDRFKAVYKLETCGVPANGHCSIKGYVDLTMFLTQKILLHLFPTIYDH